MSLFSQSYANAGKKKTGRALPLGVVREVVEHLKCEKPQMVQQLWKHFCPGRLNKKEMKTTC